MNKKKIMIIISLVLVILALLLVFIFIPKNNNVDGTYYVKVTDDNAPSTTYTLNINKDKEFTLNVHLTSALSDGTYEEDNDYTGTFSDDVMNKIDKIAKKINVTKNDFTLFYEPNVDFNDGKWYAAVYMTRALALIESNIDENVSYGNCILDEVVKLKIDQMPGNIFTNVSNNCKR